MHVGPTLNNSRCFRKILEINPKPFPPLFFLVLLIIEPV